MNLSKQTQNSTLCQQELKECSINTKVGFEEELSMQSYFIKSVQSLREKISKVRKI